MASAKAQLVKWGNSQAVRIPKSILEQANLRGGEELEIRVENGHNLVGTFARGQRWKLWLRRSRLKTVMVSKTGASRWVTRYGRYRIRSR